MVKKIKDFLFKNTSVRQTVTKNAFWLSFSNIGGRLLRAVVLIYGARALGTEGFGVFSYALSVAAFFTIFTDLGISPILTKETARTSNPNDRANILSTSFFIKIALLAAGFLVVVFVAPSFTTLHEAAPLLPIMGLVLVFDSLREFGSSLIRALERMELEAFTYIFTNVAVVVAGFVALSIAPNARLFAYAYTVGTALGAAVSFYVLRNYFKNLFSHFHFNLVKPIFTSAWPFAVSGLLGVLMINTDIILLGFFKSADEVGLYSAAQRPIQFLYLIPTIIATTIFPTLARLAHDNREKLRAVFERTVSIVFLAAIPLALGGYLLGESIMKLLYGAEYLGGTPSFQVLMLTALVNFPATLFSNAIFALDRQKALVKYAAIGALSNVALDLVLIPPFGGVGSAWATFFGQLIANMYLWKILGGIERVRILPHLKKIITSSLIMSVGITLLLSLGVNLFVIIAFAILTYFGTLAVLKEPLLRELKLIFQSAAG